MSAYRSRPRRDRLDGSRGVAAARPRSVEHPAATLVAQVPRGGSAPASATPRVGCRASAATAPTHCWSRARRSGAFAGARPVRPLVLGGTPAGRPRRDQHRPRERSPAARGHRRGPRRPRGCRDACGMRRGRARATLEAATRRPRWREPRAGERASRQRRAHMRCRGASQPTGRTSATRRTRAEQTPRPVGEDHDRSRDRSRTNEPRRRRARGDRGSAPQARGAGRIAAGATIA